MKTFADTVDPWVRNLATAEWGIFDVEDPHGAPIERGLTREQAEEKATEK